MKRVRQTRDIAAIVEHLRAELLSRCDLLREVADRLAIGADESRGGIHPAHAANKVRKIADEIARNESAPVSFTKKSDVRRRA